MEKVTSMWKWVCAKVVVAVTWLTDGHEEGEDRFSLPGPSFLDRVSMRGPMSGLLGNDATRDGVNNPWYGD